MNILIRSGRSPKTIISSNSKFFFGIHPTDKISKNFNKGYFFDSDFENPYNANPGNSLFMDSVYRYVSTPENKIVCDQFKIEKAFDKTLQLKIIETINANFDAYILPLANAFKTSFVDKLKNLTNIIKGLKIPVIIIGATYKQIDNFPKTSTWSKFLKLKLKNSDNFLVKNLLKPLPYEFGVYRDFINEVLNKSNSIGVRGEYSFDFLKYIVKNKSNQIDIIGCPSVFINGIPKKMSVNKEKKINFESKINLTAGGTIDRYVKYFNSIVYSYKNVYLSAQDYHMFEFLITGKEWERAIKVGYPFKKTDFLYKNKRIKYFMDFNEWSSFIKTFDFSVGTRLHGSIVPTISGVPSMLISRSDRTLETAQYYHLPYIQLNDLVKNNYSLNDLYQMLDYSKYNSSLDEKYKIQLKFLDKNNIKRISK